MRIDYRNYLYFILICVLMLQFVSLPVGGTHLKPYMIACVLLFPLLSFDGKFRINKFLLFEQAWVLTYFFSSLSIFYAPNTKLAIQLLLGQCILLLFFIIFRYLLSNNDYRDDILFKCFSLYVYIGLAFYIIGCIQVFVIGNTSIFYQELNEHSYRVWGCYFERDNMPRLMGLSESPNNYEYFAITIFWWSIWKRKKILAFVSLLTIVLTISTTAFVVLFIQLLLYLLYKRSINWKLFLILPILIYLGYYFTVDNEFIQGIIEVRKVRNASGSGRYELWGETIGYIEKRPILGYGLNQFREVMSSTEKASSHNNILETLISTGIVGLLLYLFFLITYIAYTLRLSSRYKDPFFIFMSLAFVMFGLANNTLTIEFVPFLLALTYSYGNNHKKERSIATT